MITWLILVVLSASILAGVGLLVRASGGTGCGGRLDGDPELRCDACPEKVSSGGAGACPGLPEDGEHALEGGVAS